MPRLVAFMDMRRWWLFILPAVLLLSSSAWGLSADELLLIVNKQEPAGVALARFYTQQRKVPAGRIVQIDVPPTTAISFADYEKDVVPPIRDFLRDNKLEKKISCLVTFYGVPLRINPNVLMPVERLEKTYVEKELQTVTTDLNQTVVAAEILAKGIAPGAIPSPLPTDPLQRTDALLKVVAAASDKLPSDEQAKTLGQLFDIVEKIMGESGTLQRRRGLNVAPSTQPAASMTTAALQKQVEDDNKALGDALDHRYDRFARAKARELSKRLGLAAQYNILQGQLFYLNSTGPQAAVDNELPLVLWPNYRRESWLANVLNFHRSHYEGPPFYMVSRIDAPTPEIAKALITTSIAVEKKGLSGRVVIDAGFSKVPKNSPNPYSAFDQNLVDLGTFLTKNSNAKTYLEDTAGLIPPHSQKDVANYVGWYSVGRYIPQCDFVAGAVGYHIASSELVELHDRRSTVWVRGLMNDGVVGSLGPVAEPYLHSFPLPNEFFPLLMTGKLTLAETYWKTNPLASWMQALVGDPLYNPYKVKPAVKVEDLPPELQKAIPDKDESAGD